MHLVFPLTRRIATDGDFKTLAVRNLPDFYVGLSLITPIRKLHGRRDARLLRRIGLGVSLVEDIKHDGSDNDRWSECCNEVDGSAEDKNSKRRIPFEA